MIENREITRLRLMHVVKSWVLEDKQSQMRVALWSMLVLGSWTRNVRDIIQKKEAMVHRH